MKKIFNKTIICLGFLILIFLNIGNYKVSQINQKKKETQLFQTQKFSEQNVRIAIHEAGHALFVILYEQIYRSPENPFTMELTKIKIIENKSGVTQAKQKNKLEELYEKHKKEDFNLHQWKYWYWLVLLGGYISEKTFFIKHGIQAIKNLKEEPKNCSLFEFKCNDFKGENDYERIIQQSKKKIKYFNHQKQKESINMSQIIKAAEEIISQPRYIKFILLLAQALLINKTIDRSDAFYIFNHNKLPKKIIEAKEAKKMAIFDTEKNKLNKEYFSNGINNLEKKINQGVEKDKLFKKIKQNILNKDIVYKEKIEVKKEKYSFINLAKERKALSINALSNKAIQELNFLKNQEETKKIKLEEITKEIDKIFEQKQKETFLIGLITPITIPILGLIIWSLLKRKRKNSSEKKNIQSL